MQMVDEPKISFKCEPEAEKLIKDILDKCIEKSGYLKKFKTELENITSTNLFDWLDHVEVGTSSELLQALEKSGFELEHVTPLYRVFYHPYAQLPRVVVKDNANPFLGAAFLVDRIADFLMVRGLSAWIEGTPLSTFRRALISKENGVNVSVVERRAYPAMEPVEFKDGDGESIYLSYEKWQTRRRVFDNVEEEVDAMRGALTLAEEIVKLVGKPTASSMILDIERRYWQSKNLAGQFQKNRQDRLGMGWANHDHHTFRSSRRHFQNLVRLFEILGFRCRERFYAGVEAGWGAQVMEHPDVRLVLFLDVDLAPDEISIDFAHQSLPELEKLGTIGLWCALHGESILNAGMHHLEAQFDFEKLTKDLDERGIKMMSPFSNFSYLKQAFTQGEIWQVSPARVKRLLDKKQITEEQAEKFLKEGAIGSHLENLERKEGYKGFNQKNVSYIIKKTDPRNFPGAKGA